VCLLQGAVTSEQQFSFLPRQPAQQQQLQQLQQQQQQQPASLQQLSQQPPQSFLDRPALTFQDTGPSAAGVAASSPLAASFDLFTAATSGQGPSVGSQGFQRPSAVPTAGPVFDSVPTVPAVTSFEQFR
jgi:hypothetical protein